MTYKDLGFNKDLTRGIATSSQGYINPEMMDSILGDSSVGGIKIKNNAIVARHIVVGLDAFIQAITYTASDADTVNWGSGHIYLANGDDIETSAGTTGDITDTTFIYYDENKGKDLQTTTSLSTAVGNTKILLAIVEEGDTGGKASINVKNGTGTLIAPGNIVTGVLTAVTQVGSGTGGYVKIDGDNNRITVNDGSNDRIIIGNLS